MGRMRQFYAGIDVLSSTYKKSLRGIVNPQQPGSASAWPGYPLVALTTLNNCLEFDPEQVLH